MQELASSPNPAPQSSVNSSQAPAQPEVKEERGNKSKFLIVIIILLVFLIVVLASVSAILYFNSNNDKETDQMSEDNDIHEEDEGEHNEEYFGDDDESDEESNEPEEPDESQAEAENTKTCTYDDGTEKISFDLPKTWNCTEEQAGAATVYSLILESGDSSLKFRIGMVLVAPCQDPTGNCPEDMIYSSGNVDLKKITNSNPGGPDTITVSGNFYKSGSEIQNVYIDFITPDLSTTNLTEAQKQELFPILDSVSYPN